MKELKNFSNSDRKFKRFPRTFLLLVNILSRSSVIKHHHVVENDRLHDVGVHGRVHISRPLGGVFSHRYVYSSSLSRALSPRAIISIDFRRKPSD